MKCTPCTNGFAFCDFKKCQFYFEVYRLYRPFCLLRYKKTSTLFWSVQTVQTVLPYAISKKLNSILKCTDCTDRFAFWDIKKTSTLFWSVQTVQTVLPFVISKNVNSNLKCTDCKERFSFVISKEFNSILKCTDCTDRFALCNFKKAQLYFELYRLYRPFCPLWFSKMDF